MTVAPLTGDNQRMRDAVSRNEKPVRPDQGIQVLTPVGRPDASCTISPPLGFCVSAVTLANSSVLAFTKDACPLA